MKKLYFAAATALLLATSSAQAGNGLSFEIDGQRVRIESPRGCSSLSCITISAPGYKGKLGNIDLKGFGSKDKDDDVSDPPPAKTTTAPAPVAAPAPAPVQSTAVPPPPAPSAMVPSTATVATAPAPVTNDVTPAPAPVAAAPAPVRCCSRSRRGRSGSGCQFAARRLGDRREQGQRAYRTVRRQSLRLCRQDQRTHPDQHEAIRYQVGRPHQGSRTPAATTTRRWRCAARTHCGSRVAPWAACSAAARPGSASANKL